MIGLLAIRHLIFIIFFLYLGIRQLALIPVLGGIVLFLYTSKQDYTTEFSVSGFLSLFERYALVLSRSFVMFGARGVLDIFGISGMEVWLRGVGINCIGRIVAHLIEYRDGKHMFHMGYYVASGALARSLWPELGFVDFIELIMVRVSFTMALYSFIVFVLGAIGIKSHRSLRYPLFVLLNLSLIFLIYHYTKTHLVVCVVLAQIYLMVLYYAIWRLEGLGQYDDEPEEDVLRAILAGKYMSDPYRSFSAENIEIINDLKTFLATLTPSTKFVMSMLNVVLVILQVYFFMKQIGGDFSIATELYFRIGIGVFFMNFLLLRKIGRYHDLQRVLAFILINFGVYASIIDIVGRDPLYLVGIGIIRSIFNNAAIFHSEILYERGLLERYDYIYRIAAILLATLCNTYFIFQLPLSLQLRFSFAFAYVGIQLFLTNYTVKFVERRR